MVIQAKDMGGHMGGLSGSTTVTVTLSDVNDNPPKFPQSKGPVPLPEPSFDHTTALSPEDFLPQLGPMRRKYWGREEGWRPL